MAARTPTRPSLPCGRPAPVPHSVPEPSAALREGWRAKLDAHLSKEGLKHSGQRLKIVGLILSSGRHFSAQEMVRIVHDKYPGIGAATVYRSIRLLEEAAILKETLVDDGRQTVYELADDDHHDHIVCLDCSEIFEFHEDGIEEIQSRVSRKLGFREERHRHVIYARCELLAKKKR